MKPRHPIYVISKGRHDCCYTANTLIHDGCDDFCIVVEPQEIDAYAEKYGERRLLVLPFSNLGLGSIPARNWVWEHALKAGAERHWILDDNIRWMYRWYRGKRLRCNSNLALGVPEEFISRYTNIAIAGLNYTMFVVSNTSYPPFYHNHRAYSCMCIDNSIEQRWRGRYNEDVDLCLQVLSAGLCTVLFNVFLIDKMRTMTMKGGNTDELYADDGRLEMARSLERLWPGVVKVSRRFKRPQHVVDWSKFDTPLARDPDFDWDSLETVNEFGMTLSQHGPVKSANVKRLVREFGES